jgi:hypothetical protein
MRKTIVAGLTALALLTPSLVYAEPSTDQAAAEHEHWRPGPEDFKAFTDARIAGLKAGLQLTPDQEKKWPAVEDAIRAMAKARQERFAAWRGEEKGEVKEVDAIARLRTRADALTQRAADLRKLADAAEPLYQSLTDDQKHRLRFLVHMAMGEHGGGWRHHHRGGWNG